MRLPVAATLLLLLLLLLLHLLLHLPPLLLAELHSLCYPVASTTT